MSVSEDATRWEELKIQLSQCTLYPVNTFPRNYSTGLYIEVKGKAFWILNGLHVWRGEVYVNPIQIKS